MSYFAAFVLGAAGAALVVAGGELVSEDWLQPANTPSRPSNTIRVYNLFIVGVRFTKYSKRTSKFLPHITRFVLLIYSIGYN